MFENLIAQIKEKQQLPTVGAVLHAPVFRGREREYVLDTIDSTFVSSVGAYVDRLEHMLEDVCRVKKVVACVNGTAALEMAIRLTGFKAGNLAITQSLSFVATANAIKHAGGTPVFLDVDPTDLGLSPDAVRSFLEKFCLVEKGNCVHRESGQRVGVCVPMHTFGMPCRIDELVEICHQWHIPLVEDAAEALGSFKDGRACGSFGLLGTLSFNGNKIITTGGGGAILTDDVELGERGKYLTTTAKCPHPWEFQHDAVAWNFRLPNINAALGCAQLEQLDHFLEIKRQRADIYADIFKDKDWTFVSEQKGSRSNYWLCAVLTNNLTERNAFLKESIEAGLGVRPVWKPLHTLPMYKGSMTDDLTVTMDIADRLVNLPSGV